MDVVGKIRSLMESRGWTEYRLSKESQIPQSTITNMFHRNTSPSISTLISICDTFDISISDFFKEETSKISSFSHDEEILLKEFSRLSKSQKEIVIKLLQNM